MTTLRELVAKYNLKFDDKNFKKADSTISGAIGKLKTLAAVAAGAFVVRGVYNIIDSVREIGDQIDKTSIGVGVSRQSLQEWEYVAGLAGVQGGEMALSLRRLQKAALDSSAGLKTYQREFQRLGITVKDSDGKLKSADVLLTEMADAMGTLETDTERVAVAQTLLGRQGSKMLALFKGGSKDIEKFKKEAHELGGVLSDELVDSAVNLTDDMWRYEWSMRGIKATIGHFLMPAINRFVQGMSKLSMWLGKIAKGTNIAKSTFYVLGTAALIAGAKMLVPFLPVILAVAALILVVDELITTFEGGDTVLRDFIDGMFGVGATDKMVKTLTQYWEILKETMVEAGTIVKQYFNIAVDVFSSLFTFLSEGWEETAEFFSKFIDDSIQNIVELKDEFVNGFNEMLNNIAKFAKNAKQFLLAMIPEPVKKLFGLVGKGAKIAIEYAKDKLELTDEDIAKRASKEKERFDKLQKTGVPEWNKTKSWIGEKVKQDEEQKWRERARVAQMRKDYGVGSWKAERMLAAGMKPIGTKEKTIEKSREKLVDKKEKVERERLVEREKTNVIPIRERERPRRQAIRTPRQKPVTVKANVQANVNPKVQTKVVHIRTPQTAAASAPVVNQSNNFNMSVSTQGKSNINELTKAGRRMSKDAASYQKRATVEAMKQRVGT